ncbi:hypothetical protein Hdeb2414_s0033g00724061 [Helianthus debilis subsp. tardiflorus]
MISLRAAVTDGYERSTGNLLKRLLQNCLPMPLCIVLSCCNAFVFLTVSGSEDFGTGKCEEVCGAN